MRSTTLTMKYVRRLCAEHQREPKDVYLLGQRILTYYSRISWQLKHQAAMIGDEVSDFGNGDLDEALSYLDVFAPDSLRIRIETDTSSIFRSRLYLEVIQEAIVTVRDYPEKGRHYYEILDHCYLQDHPMTNADLCEVLHLSDSAFYDHRKEAVMLFAVSFLFFVLPNMEKIIYKIRQEMDRQPAGVTGYVERIGA